MGQEITKLGDQHFSHYYNSLVPHNREEADTLTDANSQPKIMGTSHSTNQMRNHLSTLTKGKEKLACSSPSTPLLPSSSKDPKQLHYKEMDKLMKEFDRKCKLHYKGVGEY